MMTKPRQHMVSVVLLLSALVFVGISAWQIVSFAPFVWAAQLAQVWQGGIEAVVFIALLVLLQYLTKRTHRNIAMLVLTAIFLRRHAVDLAAMVDLVYLEIIVALGGLCVRLSCRRTPAPDTASYLRSFVLGLSAWSVCAWVASALGFGSVQSLRWLTLFLALAALTARPRPICSFVESRVATMSRAERMCAAVLLGVLALQFARSNYVIGFDSFWYGLRGEHVLVGAGSAYASQGLVSPVYYYPKMYELLLIPLSGLGSSSVIDGFTVMLYALLALTSDVMLRRLGVQRIGLRLLIVLLALSAPAVANTALEAKPDLLTTLLLMIASLHVGEFVARRKMSEALWAISCVVLAMQAKLSALPYAAAVLMILAWVSLRKNSLPTAPLDAQPHENRLAWIAIAMAVTVALLVTARTQILAGMPTIGPDPLFHLWTSLGFALIPPAGTLRWSYPKDWFDLPALALDLFFRPQNLAHIIISWPGNCWLWLAGLAGLLKWFATPNSSEPRWHPYRLCLYALSAVGLLLMFLPGYQIRGADGNYFIPGTIPATLVGAAIVASRLTSLNANTRVFSLCTGLFCLLQLYTGFMSAAWTPGTRAFDMSFNLGPRQFRTRSLGLFQNAGLADISRYLQHQHHSPRVVGCVEEVLGMRLPASFESLTAIAYSRPEYVGTQAALFEFLTASKIDYLLMPRENMPGGVCSSGAVHALQAQLEHDHAPSIEDSGYVLYNLGQARAR